MLLLFASLLDVSMSLAPGLSIKNLYLYVVIMALIVRAVTERHAGGILAQSVPVAAVHFWFIGLILIALFSWLSMLWLPVNFRYNPMKGLMAVKGQLVDNYLVMIAFFFSIRTTRDVWWAARAVLFMVIVFNGLIVVDILGIADLGLITIYGDTKQWGPFGHSNDYGGFLIFYLPLLIAMGMTLSGLTRWIYFAGAGISFIALAMTLSRSAYGSLVIGVMLAAYFFRSQIRWSRYFWGSAVLVGALLLLVLVSGEWEIVYDRVVGQTLQASNANELTSGRLGIWGEVLTKQFEHPLSLIWGLGWNFYKQSGWFNLSAHNVFLLYIFELGVLGLAMFWLIHITVLRITLRAARRAGGEDRTMLMAFFVGFAGVLVNAFFTNDSSASIYLWGYAGLMLRLCVLLSDSPEPAH